MRQSRREIVTWVGSNIVPHEASLRARLRKMAISEDEISDVVQDAYLKISKLSTVAHIRNPRSYLYATARTVLLDRFRRAAIVRIDAVAEIEAFGFADDSPSPERRANARLELERIRRLINDLPENCRAIFELRRLQGVPQKEIAARLGIPEHTVEAQATRGLKLILKALAEDGIHKDDVIWSKRESYGNQKPA